MGLIAGLLYWAIRLYITVLFGRLILDLVISLNRGWRPGKALLPIAEIVMTVTDPPLKFIRRFVPPLRLGRFQLDFSWIILVIALDFVLSLVSRLPF